MTKRQIVANAELAIATYILDLAKKEKCSETIIQYLKINVDKASYDLESEKSKYLSYKNLVFQCLDDE